MLKNQSNETFKEVLGPKVVGIVHLDNWSRTLCRDLEWFTVFSSVASGRGNAGQTNYGYANSLMERICEQRQAAGFPGKFCYRCTLEKKTISIMFTRGVYIRQKIKLWTLLWLGVFRDEAPRKRRKVMQNGFQGGASMLWIKPLYAFWILLSVTKLWIYAVCFKDISWTPFSSSHSVGNDRGCGCGSKEIWGQGDSSRQDLTTENVIMSGFPRPVPLPV